MARGNWGAQLYRGEKSYDFVGRQRVWYTASGIILLIAIVALGVRGLNEGIEFKGGDVFEFSANGHSVSDARDVVTGLGHHDPIVTENSQHKIRVQTEPLVSDQTNDQVSTVQHAIADKFGIPSASVAVQQVGPTWGKQITKKAITSLIVFLIGVVIFISFRFELKMALAAIIALIHDLLITVGIYAVLGFEVTPATVIGLLTILGYSLYDTVVVFDKVRENTAGLLGGARTTYRHAANLALNQTLVRSINTSIIALLPVGAILVVSTALLGGNNELEELALVLFVGMLSGTYSSIFTPPPVRAARRRREPQYQALAKRVAVRASGGRAAKRNAAKAE